MRKILASAWAGRFLSACLVVAYLHNDLHTGPGTWVALHPSTCMLHIRSISIHNNSSVDVQYYRTCSVAWQLCVVFGGEDCCGGKHTNHGV